MTHDANLVHLAQRLLHYYRRPIWRITAVVIAVSLVATIAMRIMSPRYTATASLTTLPSELELSFSSDRASAQRMNPVMVLSQTHTEFLLSRSIAEKVVRAAGSKICPPEAPPDESLSQKFNRYVLNPCRSLAYGTYAFMNHGAWRPLSPFDQCVARLRKNTTVKPMPGSFVMSLSVSWADPETAALAANLLTQEYEQLTQENNRAEMRSVREYLSGEIEAVLNDLKVVDRKIEAFKKNEQVYDVSADITLKMGELSTYVQQLNAARVELQEISASEKSLRDYQMPTDLVSIQATREGLEAKISALENIVEQQLAALDESPTQEYELQDLMRQRLDHGKTLQRLQDRMLATRTAEAAQLSVVQVIDEAAIPIYPTKPRIIDSLLAALLAGLVLSGGYVLVQEYRHGYVRAPDELNGLNLPIAGLLPPNPDNLKLRERMGSSVRNLDRLFSRHVEHLVGNLSDTYAGKVIATLSLADDPSRTTAVEHVVRAAADGGQRVLVIDACTHGEALHAALGVDTDAGLAEALMHPDTPLTATPARQVPGVDVVPPGRAGLSARQRWHVDRARAAIQEKASEYDLVILDLPGLQGSAVTSRLWGLADVVLCVLDATATERADVVELLDRLESHPGETTCMLNQVTYPDDFLFRS